MIVRCLACGHENAFDQPHPFHTGFANQGYLYNESGRCTLVWSSFDPAYEALAGRTHPWMLGPDRWDIIESALAASPDGTRWLARNLPRCNECHEAIGRSIGDGEIYYLEYPGSVLLDEAPDSRAFASALRSQAAAT